VPIFHPRKSSIAQYLVNGLIEKCHVLPSANMVHRHLLSLFLTIHHNLSKMAVGMVVNLTELHSMDIPIKYPNYSTITKKVQHLTNFYVLKLGLPPNKQISSCKFCKMKELPWPSFNWVTRNFLTTKTAIKNIAMFPSSQC
jgi:hypothetical protein